MHYNARTPEWVLIDKLYPDGKFWNTLLDQFTQMKMYGLSEKQRPNSLESVQEVLILASQALEE